MSIDNTFKLKEILKVDIDQKYITILLKSEDEKYYCSFGPISTMSVEWERTSIGSPIFTTTTDAQMRIIFKALKNNDFHLISLNEKKDYSTVIKTLKAIYGE